MKNYTSLVVTLTSVILVVGGLIFLTKREGGAPGQYDTLAQCLSEKGVKFYGASWCPHCAEQKRILGKSMSLIDYVECAVPGNQRGQTLPCQEAKIDNYPTWTFPDGTRTTGVQRPEVLAQKSGCSL